MPIAIDMLLKSVERMLRQAHADEISPTRCLREIEQKIDFLSFKLADSAGSKAARDDFIAATKSYLDILIRSEQQLARDKGFHEALGSLERLREALENARMQYATRNEAEEFARRTLRNLAYIEDGLKAGMPVHIVTQTVAAMLGLIVFPWERSFAHRVRTISIEELVRGGWPEWQVTLGADQTTKLGHLIRHLRNAIAHSRITFSSDSPHPEEVIIEFEDRAPGAAAPYWRAHICAADLRDFCFRFANLIEQTVG